MYKVVLILVGFLVSLTAVNADTISNGVVVNVLLPSKDALLLGFQNPPAVCTTNFKKTHARLEKSHPEFMQYYTSLMQKKALKSPITIYYNVTGNCSKEESLLHITKIK